MNPLDNYYAGATFAEGNCMYTTAGNQTYARSTIGLTAGKWYWEVEYDGRSGGGGDNSGIGVVTLASTGTSIQFGDADTGETW